MADEMLTDISLNVTVPADGPGVPVFVVWADGSTEWAFDGDVDWMAENNALAIVSAEPCHTVIEDLHKFVQAASEALN